MMTITHVPVEIALPKEMWAVYCDTTTPGEEFQQSKVPVALFEKELFANNWVRDVICAYTHRVIRVVISQVKL